MKSNKVLRGLTLILVVAFLMAAAMPAMGAGEKVRVWVEFDLGAKADVQAALERVGADFHYTFDRLNSFVVSLPENAIAGISHNPNVIRVEEDVRRYPISSSSASGLFAPATDTVDANGQIVPWGIDAVQARDVWDTNRDGAFDAGAPTGAGKTLCIIDSGFYQDHEDLPPAVGGLSQVDDDWSRDGLGHGSHVGGTITASNNSVGVVGVSPEVSVFIIKIFDDTGAWTLSSDLVNAITTCANNGAEVISMSLGGGSPSVPEQRAFDDLYSQGVLSIAAAGNDGNTAYSYPASYSSVVSVAAIDEALAIADFSQQNDQVEIAAPGVAVLSTVPFINLNNLTVDGVTYSANHIEFAANGTATGNLVDGGLCTTTGSWSGAVVLCERGDISFYDKVMNVQNSGGAAAVIYNNVPGNFLGTLGDGSSSAIVAISLSQEDGQFLVANKLGLSGTVESSFTWPASGYEAWNGTSMATPHVSAVAALIWSAYPTATNQQVRDALTQTAFDLGAAGRDNAFGFGLVQAVGALEALSGSGGGGGGGQLVTSVTTDQSSYATRETVVITVNVTDDAAAPVAGASVEVRITVPKGKIYAGVAATDANGTVVFTFGTNSGRDGAGTYIVDATATLDGYTPGSGSTTFLVQ